MIKKSIILNTDSYKTGMYLMYPPGTTGVISYIESRGGKYDQTVLFGVQAFIKEYLLTPITSSDIDQAERLVAAHGGPFNRAGWERILTEHGGLLPVVIRSAPEGTVIPTKNVLVTIENTDPELPWLTTHVETALLRSVWYPTTVATQGWAIKRVILDYLEKTGDPGLIDFKLHDFSARGVSSFETSGLGSMAHLVNFKGTDTYTGVQFADEYYGAGVAGFSIPASEHSISTSYGRNEREYALTMLNQFAKPGSVLAMVADTYDVYEFARMLGRDDEIRQKIIEHGQTGGQVVIRPDSGDPLTVNQALVEILGESFGFQVNAKGFRVLNHVRLIQGDGVNELSIRSILGGFMAHGWSADNIAFGMGGALGQMLNRDTQRFAQKASAVFINGQWIEIGKDPVTDPGKRSKRGRVTLYQSNGQFTSGVEGVAPTEWTDRSGGWSVALQPVYMDGRLVNEISFDQVRQNALSGLISGS